MCELCVELDNRVGVVVIEKGCSQIEMVLPVSNAASTNGKLFADIVVLQQSEGLRIIDVHPLNG